jgi:hypothetical protein
VVAAAAAAAAAAAVAAAIPNGERRDHRPHFPVWKHLRRNPVRRKKRQKKSSILIFMATTFKKNESGSDFQQIQIWNDRSQKQKKNRVGLVQLGASVVRTRVGLVRSGASVVRTERSGALLKCALGCALLAHFASEVRSSQAKCALKIGVCRLSAHLKAPQTDFATCALPKCASRAQNPTFAPYLRTLFSALESYSSFLWCFLLPVIAGLRPHNLCFANKQYFSFQINLIFPPLAGTVRESIVLETVVLQRDLFAPFACTRSEY